MTPTFLTADAILPMEPALPPILRSAALLIENGMITALADRAELRRTFPHLPPETHIPGVLLPGFINAHTHLELSLLAGQLQNTHAFPAWVEELMERIPRDGSALETFIRAGVRSGIAQSLKTGVTTLADISRHSAISRSEIAAMPQSSAPRVISFGEVMGLGTMRDRIGPMLDVATTPFPVTDPPLRHAIGISPHAPYTVEGPALRKAVARAVMRRLPLCMHLAENQEEAEFLAALTGPLGRDWPLMQRLNTLDDLIPRFAGGPIRWAQLHGLLISDPRPLPVLLAHVNYCDDAELAQIGAARASVVYCPRTAEFFGHQKHRYRDMRAAQINVCLGTDSLASNPDLSVLREAAHLFRRDQLAPLDALDMITRRPALALGLGDRIGSLAVGKQADIIALPIDPHLPDDALLTTILTLSPEPAALWINGTPIQLSA